MSNIENQKNENLSNKKNTNKEKNTYYLNDSLEEGNDDDNNLEYTKSNLRSDSKSYRVSDIPLMENYDNINIKNEPLNNINKNEIDEMYKKLILNKRMNMSNKNNTHFNSQSNNNIINSELFTFNNNNNENIKIPQRSNTLINNEFNFDKTIEKTYIKNNNNTNNHIFNNTTFSTQPHTGNQSSKNNNNKQLNINNKISEFIINDSLSQKNEYRGLIDINDNTEENREYLTNWLKNIDLIEYYNNFIQNDIYDIHKLCQFMKSYETKLKFDDIENLLGIRKPGHIYRILIKLEIDSGLIDSKIVKFMIKQSTKDYEKNIQISISNGYECGCFKKNNKIPFQKNELRTFLMRKNLMRFYQNFYHNGFELIEYILVQMYSSFPINDEILENCLHIYNENDRKKVLRSIVNEMKKINIFVNTKEYVSTPDNIKIKYENIQLEDLDEYNNDDSDKENLDIENCTCNIF